MKVCTVCSESRPIADYAGRASQCRHCDRERARARYYRLKADGVKRCPKAARDAQLKHRYGLTSADVAALEKKQGGRCAICAVVLTGREGGKSTGTSSGVDHCHKTGAVRGILCMNCNKALGFLNDDTDRLQKAIDYLKGY